MSSSTSKLESFVEAINQDQYRALEGLALMITVIAAHPVCKQAVEDNGFLTVAYMDAQDNMLMAIARILDEGGGPQSVTIPGVCNYAEQNRTECTWLFSPEGQAKYQDGKKELLERCAHWKKWVNEHPLSANIKEHRDKVLAHRDKKQVLGEIEVTPIMLKELRELIDGIGEFVNDFNRLIRNSYTHQQALYDQVFEHGSKFIASSEAMWREMISMKDPGLYAKAMTPLIEEINANHKAILEAE
jgi:hypothetical protein